MIYTMDRIQQCCKLRRTRHNVLRSQRSLSLRIRIHNRRVFGKLKSAPRARIQKI